MKFFLILVIILMIMNESIQNPSTAEQKAKKISNVQNLKELQELLQNTIQNSRSDSKINGSMARSNFHTLKNSSRKPKNFPFFPFFTPPPIPFGVSPGYFIPHNKEITENSYPTEWLSRTEPFKKDPILDSPTYYIRLPPNPYIFVPGIGYVSRPPALSDPEVLENNKQTQTNELGNGVRNSFYKVPINFVSNGKPNSVYQIPNGQTISKPESSLINLSKGPYVFNGKPNEIYLVAQIYDALYGDELSHFYP